MMFAGLMSRWISPSRWAAFRASATISMISIFSVRLMREAAASSVSPWMYCMAM